MRYFFTFLLFFVSLDMQAQSGEPCLLYETFMKAGKKSTEIQDYKNALNQFLSAQTAARECHKNTKAANAEIKNVFKLIAQQRDDAVKARQEAEIQKNLAKKALAEAESSNAKNQKLINAFYFYDGKFALAFKNDSYGFINQKGDAVIDYKYSTAEQFDYTGFAKVKKDERGVIIDYLIDTTGKEYKLAYTVEDLMDTIKENDFVALDLRNSKWNRALWYIESDTLDKKIELQFRKLQILIADGYFSHQDDFVMLLPHDISKFKNLTHLYLRGNTFEWLPSEIGQLKALQTLNLSDNRLTALPAEIGQLQYLQTLNLSSNLLTVLPAEIGQLKALQTLNLGGNELEALPAEIGQLKALQTLNLSDNRLTALPAEIGQLQYLQTLNLSSNLLTVLPAEIGQLKALKTLNLSSNRFTALPAEIWQLRNLQTLNLNNNPLAVLPKDIGQLKNLKELNLGHDDPEFAQIANYKNQALTALPKEIGQLRNLQVLNLSRQLLSILPEEIGQLKSLQKLDLRDNPWVTLPAGIGQLKNLKELNLSQRANNPVLTTLPDEIGQLKNLKELDLSGNGILEREKRRLTSLLPRCKIYYNWSHNL